MQCKWVHFSLPRGSKVEASSEILLASGQTEMTDWLLIPDRFLPQAHDSSLTAWQSQMSPIWRWLWNTKKAWEPFQFFTPPTWIPGSAALLCASPGPKRAGCSLGAERELTLSKRNWRPSTKLPNCRGQKLDFMTGRHNSHWFISSLSCNWWFQVYSLIAGWRGFFKCRGMSFLNQIRPAICKSL